MRAQRRGLAFTPDAIRHTASAARAADARGCPVPHNASGLSEGRGLTHAMHDDADTVFPRTHATPRRRRVRFAVLVAVVTGWWTLYGLMLARQLVDMRSADGEVYGWTGALTYAVGSTWAWVPMTVVAYLVVSRFPLGGRHLGRNVAINAGLVAGFIVAKAVYAWLSNPVFDWYPTLPPLLDLLGTSVSNNLILGIMVVAMVHGIVYFEHTEDREHRVTALEKSLALARLEAVRAQLNPHFLFNALNSVAELMQTDVEQADRMLVAICDMLRDGLRADAVQERPLRDELKHVGNYLMIEEIRLGQRVNASVRVDDACLDIPVPTLSLQPLVENAIVHAIARSRAPGWVTVAAWQAGQTLHLSVENSRAVEGARKDGNGLGQRAVEERLRLLYGERGQLHRGESDPEVYRVELQVPLPDPRALPTAPAAREATC